MLGKPEEYRLPEISEHTTVLGRTGSGKTQLGGWLLSEAPFDQMPFALIDHKGDDLLNSIEGVQHITLADNVQRPGLYIVHPGVKDDEALDDFIWRIHARGNAGLYFDEAFMVAKSKAYQAVLMQGRSKNIPVFSLSQRPSWISRHAFSEATHFAVGHLNDERDQDKVREFFREYNYDRLEPYHFQWYDVKHDRNFILKPVPDRASILGKFAERLDALKPQRLFV